MVYEWLDYWKTEKQAKHGGKIVEVEARCNDMTRNEVCNVDEVEGLLTQISKVLSDMDRRICNLENEEEEVK